MSHRSMHPNPARFIRRLLPFSRMKRGLPPGTLIHAGETAPEPPTLSLLSFDADAVEEREGLTEGDALAAWTDGRIHWINLTGLHDVERVRRIGTHLGLHPLTMEDILHTGQRPKIEEHPGYVYAVFRMLTYDADARSIRSEQVSLILTAQGVVTYQERPGDVFDPVRTRIRQGGGRVRREGSDYLFYALLDALIDGYLDLIESLGEQLDRLDETILTPAQASPGAPSVDILLQRARGELILVRKAVLPLREILNHLLRTDSVFFRPGLAPYLRDAYDHAIHVIESVDALRDMLTGLRDMYLTTLSNRLNEVMKVLTIIATLFIPATFVAGVYGMNFEDMPELASPYGYPATLGVMALMIGGMLLWFRRRGWI